MVLVTVHIMHTVHHDLFPTTTGLWTSEEEKWNQYRSPRILISEVLKGGQDSLRLKGWRSWNNFDIPGPLKCWAVDRGAIPYQWEMALTWLVLQLSSFYSFLHTYTFQCLMNDIKLEMLKVCQITFLFQIWILHQL